MTTKPRPRAASATSVAALDANALELFARIVAAGSFAAAARQLGQTRAAVSRRVAGIEAALGASLFARTTRALHLTTQGRRLASRAKAVLEAADMARRALRKDARQGLAGTLRITTAPNICQAVLAPLLLRFQAQHPDLRLELRLTYRRLDLARDDVDVAFRLTNKPPADWVATPLFTMRVGAYAAPRKKGRAPRLPDPAALAQRRCLVLGPAAEAHTLRWRHDDGRSMEVEIEPAVTCDEMSTLLAMAESAGSIAPHDGTSLRTSGDEASANPIVFAPDFDAAAAVDAGTLVNVLPGWQLLVSEGSSVQALTLPVPEAPEAARLLVRFVREALAGEPAAPARARAGARPARGQ